MQMKITQGEKIVSDLLGSAFNRDEWTLGDHDFWQDVDALITEKKFADKILVRLTDDAEDTALLIVKLLVQSAYVTFESFIDDASGKIPDIVSGLQKAKAWLETQRE